MIYLLYKGIVLEYFARFHDPYDCRLQIQFSVVIDRAHCVLDLGLCLLLQGCRNLELGPLVRIVKVEADLVGWLERLRAGGD